MPVSLESWSVLGIASILAIVAGAGLLVAHAVRRGLVHGDLDAQETSDAIDGPADPLDPASAIARARPATGDAAGGLRAPVSLGLAGAALLVVGLALGLVTAVSGAGPVGSGAGAPGAGPNNCAQSWTGCPQSTPRR
jgi:hypothetical protein